MDKVPDDYDLSYWWFNPETMQPEKTDDFFLALTTGLQALEDGYRALSQKKSK